MSKKILITGANGFLGSAITKLAIKKGYKVSVFVRKNSNLDNLIKLKSKINIYYGDLRNKGDLHEPVKESDIIFHVAADYRLWSRKPSEIYDTNVHGTENLALSVLKFKKKLVYTSSVAALGLDRDEGSETT